MINYSNMEKGGLTSAGKTTNSSPGTPLRQEFSSSSYYRQFKVSDRIDADKKLHNGVLTRALPKAEAAKPRNIEIRTLD